MYLFDFQSRLRRLNPNIYLSADARDVSFEWRALGIYLRKPKRESFGFLKAEASAEERKLVDAHEAGTDEYLCGVPADWVPDLPIFDPKTRKLVAPDWRSIVLKLVARGVFTLERAKRVFGCSSIGESDFDKASFDQKRAMLATKKSDFRKLFHEVTSNALGY